MRRKKAAAVASLPPDMLANIHGRLSLLDRLAFAAVFRASRDAFKPEAPCLVLLGSAPEAAALFSLADRRVIAVRGPGPDHSVLGSSTGGWLVTDDNRARLRLINPVTGERRAFPAITTIPCLHATTSGNLTLDLKGFLRKAPPYTHGSVTIRGDVLRRYLYRKIVLSHSGAIAMLITGMNSDAVAFATAGGGSWRLTPTLDCVEPTASSEASPCCLAPHGVEDAVHHEGRFYSITYSGEVEAWEERDADAPGVFTSTVFAWRLLLTRADAYHRKYIVAAPCGRLMVVLKKTRSRQKFPYFKVQIHDAGGKVWKETDDIGDAALFVGANGSLCVSTREHRELRAGCVYYADDGPLLVLSLKGGMVKEIQGLEKLRDWPPAAWLTPCATPFV